MTVMLRGAAIGLAATVLLLPAAQATIIDPSTYIHVATVYAAGEYDNAQLSYYNGQPVSPANRPSAYEDALTSTWNFYVDPAAHNRLLVTATDVRDTNLGYLNGSPFDLVALTGFSFGLPVASGGGVPRYDPSVAIAGESLAGPTSNLTPLESTPGWTAFAGTTLSASSVASGLTHFDSVYGTTRIFGGAAFAFDYLPSVNLLDAQFNLLSLTAFNGLGAYVEAGTLGYVYSPPPSDPPGPPAPSAPEPSTWALLTFGVAIAGAALRRHRAVATGDAAV